MNYLYGKSERKIISDLKERGFKSKEYSAHKKFLRLKPGDIIALKSKGWPNKNKANLELIAYAIVVEKDGMVYSHDPNGLGHCINVEFIETNLNIRLELGYGKTVHKITKQRHFELIFKNFNYDSNREIRKKIQRRRKRRGTTKRTSGTQNRKASKAYVADLKHNKIQELFHDHLKLKFPDDTITMEEDFVDVKREGEGLIVLYEVKPFFCAEDCIREGLGQLLAYAHQTKTEKNIELVIVGPNPPNEDELDFIKYIQENVKFDFNYIPHNV